MPFDSRQYHNLTSYQRDKIPSHFLDWENQPSTFKTYPDVEFIPLQRDIQIEDESLSDVLKCSQGESKTDVPSITDLSRILFLAYTLTRKAVHGGGYHYYRSVASAGALYPVEIYVATHDVRELQDGLYHFSIANHALIPLRNEDMTGFVADSLHETIEKRPSLICLFTSIFFRSAWKYRERAYRYHLLDTGHLIENLVIALKAQRFPFRLSYDFEDTKINHLLGLDETKEVCLAVCHVPLSRDFIKDLKKADLKELGDSFKSTSRVSNNEIEYPLIHNIHNAGLIQDLGSRGPFSEDDSVDIPGARTIEINAPDVWPEKTNCEGAFFKRKSSRNFIPEPISRNCLMSLLECLAVADSVDASVSKENQSPVTIGLLIGNAEGFLPGFYLTNKNNTSLRIVNEGLFTDLMAHICLDQKWMAHAAVHFLFITDLEKLDDLYGPRAYRYAMMNAGRLGERLYLAATAMGLGCCGIGAFYDNEAADLLALEKGSRLLYLLALGPVKSL
ncbi:MAG: SagB/ThcOx family dehydrogenase [Deltaproteobacteria bacterium]|nr:SagB/ThcOx family dehydrogenase [Deltaproteobacteria bacterium]MBW2218917.1 SagB/ThcOx family dehydrogenase [Deltaproteobacteria bacterium]